NLGPTETYLNGGQQSLRDSFDLLIPYIASAIAQRDANGGFLREYVVVDTCFDTRNATPANPKTGAGCLLDLSTGAPPSNTHGAAAPGASAGQGAASSGQGGGAGSGSGRPKAPPTPCPSPSPTPGGLPLPLPSLPTL